MFVEHKEVGEEKELDEPSRMLLRAATLLESASDPWPHGHCAWSAIVTANGDDQRRARPAGERFAKAVVRDIRFHVPRGQTPRGG